jgi:hypothetical protein
MRDMHMHPSRLLFRCAAGERRVRKVVVAKAGRMLSSQYQSSDGAVRIGMCLLAYDGRREM